MCARPSNRPGLSQELTLGILMRRTIFSFSRMPNDPKLHFRAVLLEILDRLTANDRKKLAFLLSDNIERQISDDPTIGGTLNVFQQLFDRDKISEENFSYLIEAFKAIKCQQAAKSLTSA